MINSKLFLTLFLLLSACLIQASDKNSDPRVDKFKSLLNSKCLNDPITDNKGNGLSSAYGTRNMKVVLHGLVYRGGANNYYHKSNKRDNHNPLPPDGLKNLAGLGFSAAYYLYTKNFDSAQKVISNNGNSLNYFQNSANTDARVKEILLSVFNLINNKEQGPIYLHCWNGWHQSGYISACILMQFCGFSNQDALNYWISNTAGNNKGYDHIKKAILEFSPYEEFKISKEQRNLYCPCND